ncbi:MAG: hypothetical protein RID91_22290 [Azospirillaceae bacterium]
MHDPWTIDPADWPADAAMRGRLAFALGYAVLAPSSHNTQPWLFRLVEDGERFGAAGAALEVLADRTRALPVVDPLDRELTISCGAAIGVLEIALRRFGHAAAVIDLTGGDLTGGADPDLLARVVPGAEVVPVAGDIALADAIAARRTTRSAFPPDPVPEAVLKRCRGAAYTLGVELVSLGPPGDPTAEPARRRIADLVAEADRLQFADPRFRRELALWIHSRRAGSHDGLSGASFGMPDLLSPVGALVVRTFDMGEGVAAGDAEKIAHGSPCLAVLATAGDTPSDWLATGRALVRALLILTAEGYTASYLNQPIEVEQLGPRLREAAGVAGYPQILLRVGKAPATPPAPTPRRPVEAVMAG